MAKPLHILAVVLPFVGVSLVACVDGLPEETPVAEQAPATSTSDAPAAQPGKTNAAPAPSSSPQPSSSAQPSTPPSTSDAGTADASSSDASTNPTPDAGVDAAPPPPAVDYCSPIAMSANAQQVSCIVKQPEPSAGGTISNGTYYLSEWSDGASCTNQPTRQATMYIEQIEGRTHMRWIRSATNTGTASLDPTPKDPTILVRAEVCNKRLMLLGSTAVGYTATSGSITFTYSQGYEKWTRVLRTIPKGEIITDPPIVIAP